MNIRIYRYNIHGIATIESIVPLKELQFFSVAATDHVDMTIGRLKGGPRTFLSNRITVQDSSIIYSEHFDSLGSKVKIDCQQVIEIHASQLLLSSRNVLYVNIVEPLLRLILISKGYVLLHAACLAMNGSALLISAPPDTGKTTTILKCLGKLPFEFLSDDMTIIDESGTAYCFPKPLTISAHTFHVTQDADGIGSKTFLKARGLVHSRMGRRIMRLMATSKAVPILSLNSIGQILVRPPKVDIRDLRRGVPFSNGVKAKRMYFLSKGPEHVETLPLSEAVDRAVAFSNDAFFFPPYDRVFPFIKVGSKNFADLMLKEEQIIRKVLSGSEILVLKSQNRRWSEMICGEPQPASPQPSSFPIVAPALMKEKETISKDLPASALSQEEQLIGEDL